MTVSGTFREAVEAKDLSAIARSLDPGIEFHSPVMVKPYLGRDTVVALLGVLLEVFEDFRYTDELASPVPIGGSPDRGGGTSAPAALPGSQALIFNARVAGKAVQGLDLLRFGDAGLVTGLTVMVRPLPAAMTLARVVGRRMEGAERPEGPGGPSDPAQHQRTGPSPGVEGKDGK